MSSKPVPEIDQAHHEAPDCSLSTQVLSSPRKCKNHRPGERANVFWKPVFNDFFFLSIPLTAFRSVMMPGLSCVSVFVSNTTRTPDGESWQRLILFSSLSSAYLPAFHLFAIQIASPASVMLLERKKKLPSGDGESYDGGDFGSGLCSTQCDTSFTSPWWLFARAEMKQVRMIRVHIQFSIDFNKRRWRSNGFWFVYNLNRHIIYEWGN